MCDSRQDCGSARMRLFFFLYVGKSDQISKDTIVLQLM